MGQEEEQDGHISGDDGYGDSDNNGNTKND
jgi:hypothetical protein